MRLASPTGQGDPISAETRRLAALLARPKTGEILARLHHGPYLAASEIARLTDIHVATAQRYLKDLVEAGVLGVRIRDKAARPTEEYWLLEAHITIDVDLDRLPPEAVDALRSASHRIAVRQRAVENVVYDTDPRTGDLQGLLLLSTAGPRQVEDRIRLAGPIARFLAHVPHSDADAAPIWDIMTAAGLDAASLPEVLGAVERFGHGNDGNRDGNTDADPDGNRDDDGNGNRGTTSRLDPETQRLFAHLRGRLDGYLGAPKRLPILDIFPLDQHPDPPSADHGEQRAAQTPEASP